MTPTERAAALGHNVEWDPPLTITPTGRWTCKTCSDAVLEREGTVYGEAIERTCEQAQADWAQFNAYMDGRAT
ncbi:hypothetical protein ACQEVF_32555 [Nonomuraea polychroma]|uniref:hypothetical protein n=1 Tax=Nonomuraea polychroma TaxID=46176 RepID=UPI003D91CFE8